MMHSSTQNGEGALAATGDGAGTASIFIFVLPPMATLLQTETLLPTATLVVVVPTMTLPLAAVLPMVVLLPIELRGNAADGPAAVGCSALAPQRAAVDPSSSLPLPSHHMPNDAPDDGTLTDAASDEDAPAASGTGDGGSDLDLHIFEGVDKFIKQKSRLRKSRAAVR